MGAVTLLSATSLLASAILKPVLASPLVLPFNPLAVHGTNANLIGITSHGHHEGEDAPRTPLKLAFDILSIAGLVLLGGVFAGLTLGLMGLDPINLQVLSTSGSAKEQKNALKVLRLLEKGRHWVLVVLLLGNVIVNETLPVFLSDFGGGIAAVLSSTVLIVIFGEIVPQSICARHGLAIGAFCAPLVHLTMILFAPVAWPTAKLLDYCLGEEHGTTYRKAELKTLVSLHAQLGTEHLHEDEVTIIRAVLDLNDKTVEDVMTPIEDVWTLSHDEILNEAMINRIIKAGYSRIPIHEPGQPDAILGMLLIKKLISYDPEDALPVSYFQLTPLPEATPDLNCFDALTYFRSGRSHLLLISATPGEAGGALGIVTLEDVVEELLGGEIIDETDYYVDVHTKTKVVRPRHRDDSKGGGEEHRIQPLIRGIIERRRKQAGSESPFRKSFGLPSTSIPNLKESGAPSPRAFIPTSAPGFPLPDMMGTATDNESSAGGGKYGAVGTMTPGTMSRATSRAKTVNPNLPLRHRPGSPVSNAGSSYVSDLNGGFALPNAAMEDSVTSSSAGGSEVTVPAAKKTSWWDAALSQTALTGTRNLSRSRTIEDAMARGGSGSASGSGSNGSAGVQRFSRRSIPDDLNGSGRQTPRARSVDGRALADADMDSPAERGPIIRSSSGSGFGFVALGFTPSSSSDGEGGSGSNSGVVTASVSTPQETLTAAGAPNLSTLSENPRAEELASANYAAAEAESMSETKNKAEGGTTKVVFQVLTEHERYKWMAPKAEDLGPTLALFTSLLPSPLYDWRPYPELQHSHVAMIFRINLHLFLFVSLVTVTFALETVRSGSASSSSPRHAAPLETSHQLYDSRSVHPALNVTEAIPYINILRNYIASKDHGKDRCSTIHPRAEWRTLTDVQRQKWINATWCLTTRPSMLAGTETNLDGRRTSLFDDFSLLHVRLFYTIHYVAAFLPWHRWYVRARELAMRDCGFEGPFPYWDWAVDADTGDVQASPMLSNSFGVGGNGSYPDGTLTSGPFAYLPASYRSDEVNQSVPIYDPHYLQRAFGTLPAPNKTYPMFEEGFNTTAVRRVLSTSGSNFSTFSPLLEGLQQRLDIIGAGPHSAVHLAIGADGVRPHAPNEPLFFLHHTNIDRIWWYWQNGDTTGRGLPADRINTSNLDSRFWAFSGNTVQFQFDSTGGPEASLFDVQTLEGLYLPNIETYKLMDITRPPLCYKYV
ncbi:unnamed protein product [Tilletia controversa]|nr:unnamed protein product [Tilletia controversa]